MKFSFRIVVVVVTLQLTLSGAAIGAPQNTGAGGNTVNYAGEVEIDDSSPEKVIRSWWAYLDGKEQIEREDCRHTLTKMRSYAQAHLSRLARGRVFSLNRPTDLRCSSDVIQREIQQVINESKTRVLVFAIIKNVTPPPPNVKPDENDLTQRQMGFPHKYVVEKHEGRWKISDVYKLDYFSLKFDAEEWRNGRIDVLKKTYVDKWMPVYAHYDGHYYPSFIGQN